MIDVRLVTYEGLPEGDEETAWLAGEFRRSGFSCGVEVWSDPRVDWSGAEVTLIRSTWDYHERRSEFLQWAEQVESQSRLINPFSLLRWNSHKAYLLELSDRGVPTLPTTLLSDPTPAEVTAAIRELCLEEAVVKPAVGADGEGVMRMSSAEGAEVESGFSGDWMVQPFVRSVAERGEVSVVFFGGEVANVVRKRPAVGDFRVQERFGGTVVAEIPREAWVAPARACAELFPRATYLRADLVEYVGEPVLMELELVEPSFFLREGGENAGGLVDAVRDIMR